MLNPEDEEPSGDVTHKEQNLSARHFSVIESQRQLLLCSAQDNNTGLKENRQAGRLFFYKLLLLFVNSGYSRYETSALDSS